MSKIKPHYTVVIKSRSEVKGTPLERYNTNDKPEKIHAVAYFDRKGNVSSLRDWTYTEFDDNGGLRHLTVEEALGVAATRNKELGWKPDNTEGVIAFA